MSTIISAKAALRKEIASIISKLSTEEKNRQSQGVFKKIASLPQYERSKRISIYLSTSDEIDTVPILEDLFAKDKEVFVPRYNGKVMEMVKLKSMEDYDKLPLTKWNIKQPDLKEERDNALKTGGLDLVILPGVAFTKSGKRLGHGKGYYDAFLANVEKQQQNMPYLVALAFKEQLKNDIPTTDHDVILNVVLTE